MTAASSIRVCVLAVVVFVTTNARADERASITTSVTVDAPATCATADDFRRSLARRTDRLAAVGSNAEVALDVSIRPDGRGATGRVRVVRAGRAFAKREVRGATCDEVTQALSLVVALAFDPAARVDVDVVQEEEEPSTIAAASPTPAPPTTVLAEAPAPVREETREQPPPKPRAAEEKHWRVGLGAHASIVGAAAPGATAGFGGFVDLERDAPGLSPSFRAGVLRSTATTSANAVNAHITWTIARVSACPLRLDLASSVTARPCIGIDAGSMAATASAVDRAFDKARPWIAGTAAVRLAWSPLRVAFVEAEAGVTVPVVRDELAVDPSISLYKTPGVVPAAQIAAGVRFP